MTGVPAMLAALLCTAGCSFVIDKQVEQCSKDTDCAHFDDHLYCRDGACTASGPDGCIEGPRKTQTDYLNACSTSVCEPFSDCDRLGLFCPGKGEQQLPTTQVPATQMPLGLVNSVPIPTNLCTEGAPGDPLKPNMIYLFGSADFGPLLQAAQPSLSIGTPAYRAVFQANSSCNGVDKVFNADSTPQGKRFMFDPAETTGGGWPFYFDASGQQVNCRLDPPPPAPQLGVNVDIGISDLYAPTCNPQSVPGPTVAEYLGPVVPFVLSVPATSTEKSISAAAAHFVFGLGGKAPTGTMMKDATPWTDPTSYAIRSGTSGSTVLTALMADVPTKFWGVDRLTTELLQQSAREPDRHHGTDEQCGDQQAEQDVATAFVHGLAALRGDFGLLEIELHQLVERADRFVERHAGDAVADVSRVLLLLGPAEIEHAHIGLAVGRQCLGQLGGHRLVVVAGGQRHVALPV